MKRNACVSVNLYRFWGWCEVGRSLSGRAARLSGALTDRARFLFCAVRIGEEQLIAVRVFNNHRVIAPPDIQDRRALLLEFGPQRLQQNNIDRNEDAAAPDLFRLLSVEEDFTT